MACPLHQVSPKARLGPDPLNTGAEQEGGGPSRGCQAGVRTSGHDGRPEPQKVGPTLSSGHQAACLASLTSSSWEQVHFITQGQPAAWPSVTQIASPLRTSIGNTMLHVVNVTLYTEDYREGGHVGTEGLPESHALG